MKKTTKNSIKNTIENDQRIQQQQPPAPSWVSTKQEASRPEIF